MSFMQIHHLKVYYPIRSGFFHRITDYVLAVDDISMEFERGKTYGLVGESGCGKSTIGKAIIGLEKVTSGRIIYEGKDVTWQQRHRKSTYNRNIQMIFQDVHASLNPRKRVQDIIAEPIRNFLKLSPQEESKKISELLAIVGMPEDTKWKFPHEFSGGQKQRLGIARAMATNPTLIIADEPVSALDVSVQAQILNFMKDIQQQYGVSYLFISHDLSVVQYMCDSVSIMHKGRFVETGTKQVVYHDPQHIYTQRLLSAIPSVHPSHREERQQQRIEVAKYYKKAQRQYFDNNGRVYDLVQRTDNHFVAMREEVPYVEDGD